MLSHKSPKDWESIMKAELPYPESIQAVWEDVNGIQFIWNMSKYMLDHDDGVALTWNGEVWTSDNSCLLITHILRRYFAK